MYLHDDNEITILSLAVKNTYHYKIFENSKPSTNVNIDGFQSVSVRNYYQIGL